ncbi:MAG: ABC transporter ATP-binding protein, partial [Clostridia bacterium]|nr:ABC transporter ATP-binding protein [Clostridia bacterium]
MITVQDLRASYEGEEILHGIDASFPEGKISAIIGPNGNGKSTAIRSILRLMPDISGSILLDGEDMSRLTRQEIARRIAYLPQSRSVPDVTVGRLVLQGRFSYLSYPRHYRRDDHEKAAQALEWVGLSGFSERKMENLSGGQRQKAYLAMALAQDTDVIMMDEPTTFLDI